MAAGAVIILIAVCAAMIVANVCFKRSARKLADESRSYGADGDCFPVTPDDVELFHAQLRTNSEA